MSEVILHNISIEVEVERKIRQTLTIRVLVPEDKTYADVDHLAIEAAREHWDTDWSTSQPVEYHCRYLSRKKVEIHSNSNLNTSTPETSRGQ
jgi:hypothetical protein